MEELQSPGWPGWLHQASPKHVTQRGNRRQRTFFKDSDCLQIRSLLAESNKKAGTRASAYCLLSNQSTSSSPESPGIPGRFKERFVLN
jgi:hypothetical protein